MSSKVFVGLSGGVDSSVAAALLKAQGYDVTGVYMKNWAVDLPGFKCPWREDLADAKRVAVQLDIPFKIYDFQEQYKQKVVDYMIDEYKSGRTPNPDITCNQEIKFKLFLNTALEDGADMVATGHYARVVKSKSTSLKLRGSSKQKITWELHMATDKNKDQTYFLYRMPKVALGKTLFPLGQMTKPEVRKKAAELGLVTAKKKDSVGICFVGEIGIKEFLMNFVKTKPGPIVDQATSKIVGEHDGALYYTIGQRHGLGAGGGIPYYVIKKDMGSNTVFVSTDLNAPALWQHEIQLHSLAWLKSPPLPPKAYQVRIRHQAPLVDATIIDKADGMVLQLQEDVRALTSGQSAVIYNKEVVVGGGIIL